MSRHMPNTKMKSDVSSDELCEYIEALIMMWLDWMCNHEMSNNEELSFRERRVAGELCESLQRKRHEIMENIDALVDGKWVMHE